MKIACFVFFVALNNVYAKINYGYDLGDFGFPGEFLTTFAASARALGMGKISSTLLEDSSISYLNPAGLIQLEKKDISLLQSNLFNDVTFQYIGFAFPFKYLIFGFSRIELSVKNIPKISQAGKNEGSFTSKELAYNLSFGIPLKHGFSLGVNTKILQQQIDIYSAPGIGLDLTGLFIASSLPDLYNELLRGFRFAIGVQNIVRPTIVLKEEKDTFPTNLILGLGWSYNKKFSIGIDTKFENVTIKPTLPRYHIGAEYIILDILALRVGSDYKDLSFGVGFKHGEFSLDYAYLANKNFNSNHFSLNIRFGKSVKEIEKERLEIFLPEIKEYYQNSLKYLDEKRFEDAKMEIKKILSIDPENVDAKNLQKKILKIDENRRKAKKDIQKAIELHHRNQEIQALKTKQEAILYYEDIIKELENEFLSIAENLIAINKFSDAEKIIVDTIWLNPENIKAAELLKKIKSLEFFK